MILRTNGYSGKMPATQHADRAYLNPGDIGLTKRGKKISVLIVDDEFADRKLMTQILRSFGFEIIGEAENGKTALDLYCKKKPRIIILDMLMPGMSGLAFLRSIKFDNPHALVIMCTSVDDKATVGKLLEAGAVDYIVKPIDRSIIFEKMSKLVVRYESMI